MAFLVTAYTVFFGGLTWRLQSHYGTFGFDLGIFDQEIWLASRFKPTFITVRGLDMWANHVNPTVYLLTPFYWLGAGPHFLAALQTFALAAGAIPLWLIARDRFGDGWLSTAVPVAWLLYPSVEWMTWWHFHPEGLAVTPLLFAWWFAGRGRWWGYGLCVALVVFAKEDAALAAMALGAVVALRFNRRAGLITVGASLAWMLVCLKVIIPDAAGVANPFYTQQYSELGANFNQIVWNTLRHPSRASRMVFRHDRYAYYLKMLVPVAGVALLAPAVLLLAVPTALENVLNNQGYPHDYRYQYQCFVAAGIFLAVIDAIGRRRRPATRRVLVGAVLVAALASNVAWSPSPLNADRYRHVWANRATPHTVAMDAAVRLVPAGASVAATYTVVPHLTHRTHIYEWPTPWMRGYYGLGASDPLPDPATVQYLVIDTVLNPAQLPLLRSLTAPGGEFQVLFESNAALVARRVTGPRAVSGP